MLQGNFGHNIPVLMISLFERLGIISEFDPSIPKLEQKGAGRKFLMEKNEAIDKFITYINK
ncbi:MAG: hypothetical protein P8L83_00005 [Flavobacteriaceae bacterium]|nr:hypothetical protein [Flavobacteriaceae bacterium]